MDLNAYLQDLEFLVNIDSGPDAPEGQTRIAEFFQNRFAALGWQTDLYPLPGHDAPCLVCRNLQAGHRNRQAGHYDVLLIGHIDTVFPKGTAAQRPFRRDEARAYGPGVLDMKQGALMMYYVLRDLPAPVCQKLNILAVFNPDEEIGSPHSQPLTDSLAAQTDYVLVYEGASADGARCARRKGRLTMTMDFTGKPCHCGYVFQNDGRSAISEMARWIVALDALQDQARGTSVNVGVVSGGTNLNTVAEHASMQVDVRFLQNSESRRMDDTLAALLQQAERRGIQVQIHSRKLTPALEPTPQAERFLNRVRQVATSLGQEFTERLRGGVSDANHLARQGSVCLDALGPGGDDDHTAQEYLNLDSIVPAWRLSQGILQDLATGKTT